MIKLMDFTEKNAENTLKKGDFPESILFSAENVAVVLTQDWCPQWKYLESALKKLAEKKDTPDIDVYIGIYNLMGNFHSFMTFKEITFGNQLIPYIRYYKKGKLIDQSNFVATDRFLSVFKQ